LNIVKKWITVFIRDWIWCDINSTFLLICLTVSSRKDLSIAPCFYRGFFISYTGH
jgi:hypothetical protein